MVWGVVDQLPYLGKQGGHLRHRHADLLRAGQEADGEKKKEKKGGRGGGWRWRRSDNYCKHCTGRGGGGEGCLHCSFSRDNWRLNCAALFSSTLLSGKDKLPDCKFIVEKKCTDLWLHSHIASVMSVVILAFTPAGASKLKLDLLSKTMLKKKKLLKSIFFLSHAPGLCASLQNVKVLHLIHLSLFKMIENPFLVKVRFGDAGHQHSMQCLLQRERT